VAEDESDTLYKEIRIYFVEREQGGSRFRNVDLNEFGVPIKWPKGFFDEGPRESRRIMEAALNKRKLKMEKGK
jgi:predicted ATPase